MAAAALPAAIIGSSIIGGIVQSNAASKAAKAQTNAANQANATQQQMFNTTQTNLRPYIGTGNAAASKLSQLEGLSGSPDGAQAALQSLPGYQFANTQGLKSVQNGATARGLGVSGAAQKGAAEFSTGLANQYYNNLLNGVQNTATMGANAANNLATNATATGGEIGNNLIGAGNAVGGRDIAQGNAISGGIAGIPNALIANSLLKNQTGGATDGSNNFLAQINDGTFTPDNAVTGFGENAAPFVAGGSLSNILGI